MLILVYHLLSLVLLKDWAWVLVGLGSIVWFLNGTLTYPSHNIAQCSNLWSKRPKSVQILDNLLLIHWWILIIKFFYILLLYQYKKIISSHSTMIIHQIRALWINVWVGALTEEKNIYTYQKKKSIFTTEQSHWEAPTAAY